MKKLVLILLNALFLYGINGIYAQHVSCGFDHQQEAFFESHPEAHSSHLRMKKRMKKAAVQHEERYVIPVVFHIFGTTFNGNTKVDYNLVKDALRRTNEDFQGLTADYNQTDPSSRFEKIKKPLNLEFRLAQIDPKGNPTTGVLFFEEKSGFGDGQSFNSEIQKYAWDNKKYMNIYIMNDLYADGDLYNSGVSWLPDDWMTENNLARVVYNGSYLGDNADVTQNSHDNFRRILTHEFGHFMGLHHTFQGGCTEYNDGIEDTPAVATSQWDKDELNCYGEYTDWENFMNYTDHYRHFTAGQVDLMEKYLHEPARSTLWQEANLIATGTNDNYISEPCIIASGYIFSETVKNQGELDGSAKIEAFYGLEFTKNGDLSFGTDYTATDLPEGLTPVLAISDNTHATLKLTGKANNHEIVNNKTVKFRLNASCLKTTGTTVTDAEFKIEIEFRNTYTSLCSFESRFASHAYISNVTLKKINNDTKYDRRQSWSDFSESHVAELVARENCQLTVTAQNYSSDINDSYKVRLWIDWNGDYILQPEEAVGLQKIAKIGDADAGEIHKTTFDITVPETAVQNQKFNFRVMLHYAGNDVPSTDGKDPCGVIDSGDVEDYGIIIKDRTSIDSNKLSNLIVYPNPTTGLITIDSGIAMKGYSLYTISGQLIQRADFVVDQINLNDNAKGMYILQLETIEGSQREIIILE